MGSQVPNISLYPKQIDGSLADDAKSLMDDVHVSLDQWQVGVLRHWLDRNLDGYYTSATCMLDCPRQNGKTMCLWTRAFFGAFIIGERVLYTAHELKTARAAFDFIVSVSTRKKAYREHVTNIRRTNGQEAISFDNGGCIEFSARTRNAARGFTFDVLILDEAQSLTDMQMSALSSVTSAAPLGNPQTIMTGTAPDLIMSAETFSITRGKIIMREDAESCIDEWSVEDVGDVTDRKRWEQANPALGGRLLERALISDLTKLSKEGFAREHLGWWQQITINAAIPKEKWDACGKHKSAGDNKLASFGVKFSVDSYEWCLSGCMTGPNVPHVELINMGRVSDGLDQLKVFLAERLDTCNSIVIDGKGTSDALRSLVLSKYGEMNPDMDDSTKKYINGKIRTLKADAAAAVCPLFLESIVNKNITHASQPTLDKSVKTAKKRKIGTSGGWGLAPSEGTDITPAESAAIAYYAATEIVTEEIDDEMGLYIC